MVGQKLLAIQLKNESPAMDYDDTMIHDNVNLPHILLLEYLSYSNQNIWWLLSLYPYVMLDVTQTDVISLTLCTQQNNTTI